MSVQQQTQNKKVNTVDIWKNKKADMLSLKKHISVTAAITVAAPSQYQSCPRHPSLIFLIFFCFYHHSLSFSCSQSRKKCINTAVCERAETGRERHAGLYLTPEIFITKPVLKNRLEQCLLVCTAYLLFFCR